MRQVRIITACVLGLALLLPVLEHLLAKRPLLRKAVSRVLLAFYALANIKETLLFRDSVKERGVLLVPFESYRRALELPEGWSGLLTGVVKVTKWYRLAQILLNVLLYMPLGYLLPLAFPRMKGRHVVLTGFLCSLATELLQLILRIGWFEVDDLINNTLGCALGWLLYMLLCRRAVFRKRQ